MKSVSELISEYRKNSGYNQTELAALLNKNGYPINNKMIWSWEKGLSIPNASQYLAILEVLNVTNSSLSDLTPEGQYKVQEYINTLLLIDKYRAIKKKVPLYETAVSAGTGQYIENAAYSMTEVNNEKIDYGVYIAGNSMEPRIKDHTIVWVQTITELRIGDIGIFYLDGETYCKVLGNNELISINKKYEPIPVTEANSFRILGKVVDDG